MATRHVREADGYIVRQEAAVTRLEMRHDVQRAYLARGLLEALWVTRMAVIAYRNKLEVWRKAT